jgi:hypothetical protein
MIWETGQRQLHLRHHPRRRCGRRSLRALKQFFLLALRTDGQDDLAAEIPVAVVVRTCHPEMQGRFFSEAASRVDRDSIRKRLPQATNSLLESGGRKGKKDSF